MPIDPRLRPQIHLPKAAGRLPARQGSGPSMAPVVPQAKLPELEPSKPAAEKVDAKAEHAHWAGAADPITAGRARDLGLVEESLAADGHVVIGPDPDPAHVAKLAAAYAKLETPSYLATNETAPAKKPELATLANKLPHVVSAARAAMATGEAVKDPLAAARLEGLLAGTVGLPEVVRSHLFDAVTVAGARSDSARVMGHIIASPAWSAFTRDQRTQLADVLSTASAEGVKNLGALFEAAPARLLETDAKGGTLLSTLARVGSQPLNATLYAATTPALLLSSLLRDLANPNRIDQGTSDTCTVTSMQYELANDAPAEYARLVAGIAGESGTVGMRGGGRLRLVAGIEAAESTHGRSISSQLFQSAAMDDANGKDLFDPILERSTKPGGAQYSGLSPSQQTRILGQLFGVKYATDNLQTESESARALETLRGFDAHEHRNRPVLLDLDQGPTTNHTVTLERIEDGKVFFRDPYGELRSIPETAFAKVVFGIHQPS